MTSSNLAFEQFVGDLDYPMFIVTARTAEERAGCLVGFATQCSIAPPRFLACVSRNNRTFRVATRATLLIVHAIPAEARDLAELFGAGTGDELDKFDRCRWRPGPDGTPILSDCGSWFAGDILAQLPLGDHVGFLLVPREAEAGDSGPKLSFQRTKGIEPGHEA